MQEPIVLIADIGGTNARFAIADLSAPYFSNAQTLQCTEFNSIYDAIDVYLKSQKIESIEAICFAVAGPIINSAVTFPNSHWHVESSELVKRYRCKQAHLVNDFKAIAYSVAILGDRDLIEIGSTQNSLIAAKQNFTVGVIGPGSGLGIAGLHSLDGTLFPITTEGGHAGFAPENILQGEILNYLRQRFNGRVSRERLLSGPGLINIYTALSHIRGQQVETKSAADIAVRGTQEADGLCHESMQLFFEILGQTAGDLALSLGAYNGIYIGGGIAQRYPEDLAKSSFRQAFENKGRHSDILKDVPTYLISHQNPGLIGASVLANQS